MLYGSELESASVYLRPGSASVSPEVRAPPIIAMRAIFSMRMSCDTVESESNAQLPRSILPSFVLESYEEP